MEIRFAKPEDVLGILALLKQVGQIHHDLRPDIFRAGAQKYGPSQILAMLDRNDMAIFVAVEEENVLGYGFCVIKNHKQDPVIAEFKELYIDDLCVDEKRRGQHIGKKLYEAICKYARMCRCRSITLNVWSCNQKAMAFYESLGLTPQKVGMEFLLEEE